MESHKQSEAERAIRAYLEGEDTPEGKRLYEQWYASFADENTANVTADTTTAGRIWTRIRQQIHPIEESENQPRIIALRSYRPVWMAATLTGLATLATLVWFITRSPTAPPVAQQLIERLNEPGQRSVVRLPDSSVVYLNAASQLRYRPSFTGQQREVWLVGEAFFQVRRNPQKPFVVHTGRLRTTVLGTSFTIRAFPTEPRVAVAVVTGKVQVADAHRSVQLSPNQEAVYRPANASLVRNDIADARIRMAWTTGRLVFQSRKVADIIAVLERHYGVHISLTDKHLANYALNAEFDNEPLTQVLDVLCGYLKTNYQKNGNVIRIGS